MNPNCIACIGGVVVIMLVAFVIAQIAWFYIERHAPLAHEDDEHGFVLDDPERK